MPGIGLGVGKTEINDINFMLLELSHNLVVEMQPTNICNEI